MNENERGSRTARSRSRRVCLRSADPPRARWLPGSLRVKPEAASPLLTWGESGGSRPGPTRRPHRGAHTCGWGGLSGPGSCLSGSGLRRCSPRGASPPGNRPVSQTSEAARLPGFRPRAARPGVGFPETPAGSGPREPPSRGPPAEKGRGLGSQLRPLPAPPVRAQGRAGMRGPAPILTLAPSSFCAAHDRGQKRAEESCFSPRPNPVLASKGVTRILGRARWDAQTALSLLSFRRACVFALVCLCFKLRLIYRVVFVSAVRRSDSVIRILFEESFPMGLS